VLVKSTGERVYYPTTRLITLPVINLTRSTARSEKVLFLLDVGKAATSAREALLECVRTHYEENESDFNSCPRCAQQAAEVEDGLQELPVCDVSATGMYNGGLIWLALRSGFSRIFALQLFGLLPACVPRLPCCSRSVNFVTLLDPFKVQLSVVWTYNFGREWRHTHNTWHKHVTCL
jgi:hypothetical protein